jgi:polar amino acid transport system substrate-binding protein
MNLATGDPVSPLIVGTFLQGLREPGSTIGRNLRIAAAVLLMLIPVAVASAQDTAPELRVATRIVPPLVLEQTGSLTGFSIELWNTIAERMKVKTSFVVGSDVDTLLEAVRSGKADLGVSAVSITSEREADFDFSQPILNAGLQIMVRSAGEAQANPLRDLLQLLFSPTILVWLGIALLMILIPAHLIWLLERRHPHGIIPNENYFPGIFFAMYWAAGTLATQADQSPRQWLARVIAVLWMFTGVVFVAFYTAQLTATLAVQQIQGMINGPDELPGRSVGTTMGSTADAYLRKLNAQVREFANIEDAYTALLDRRLDAVVFDAPVLLHYAAHDGKGRVQVVGKMFHQEDYGIVFPPNSALRKKVDGALLTLREDGTYARIHDKWFAGK